MNTYLFLFTVGPVQGFLVQARKTKDLYCGSKILSDLISHAISSAQEIINSFENNIVFPNPHLDSKPNRFIAKIVMESDDEVKNFGEQLEKAVITEFAKWANDKFDYYLKGSNKPSNFEHQIKEHLQIYWVALPLNENDKYEDKFKEIESSLGAIKNLRMFDQIDEAGRKCSLCGERNALIYFSSDKDVDIVLSNGFKKRYIQNNSLNVVSNDKVKYFFNDNEGLCAVCFAKRFYEEKEFPSTAEIALMESVKRIEENDKNNVSNYKKIFGKKFDYQLFFEENLTEKYFKKHVLEDITKIDDYKKKLSEIKKIARENNILLTPYYAIVLFDGDSMGEWLSGKNLNDISQLESFHKTLSNALGEFANEARNIVVNPKGAVVYAGGEDFLAFINLNHLFDILKELRNSFNNIVNCSIESLKLKEKNLSFSAGIVIPHYKYPLSEALKWARKLEREAKDIDDNKNAFAIAVMKHSGEVNQAVYKWGEFNDSYITKNLEQISFLINELKEDKFSSNFIKNLDREFRPLLNEDGKLEGNGFTIADGRELINSEIKRLLKNSCKAEKLKKESKTDYYNRAIKPLEEKLIELHNKIESSTRNFLDTLEIAEFISKQLNK